LKAISPGLTDPMNALSGGASPSAAVNVAMSRWIDCSSTSFTGPTQLEKTTWAIESVANSRACSSPRR
jgi:hypothetical protein